MKYVYISEVNEVGVGVGDYSRAFCRVLKTYCAQRGAELNIIDIHGSERPETSRLKNALTTINSLSAEDIVHIELCRKDKVRWKLLEEIALNNQREYKIHVTIHDPPEVIGSLSVKLFGRDSRESGFIEKVIQKLYRMSPQAQRRIKEVLSKVDRVYCLTDAGVDCLKKQFNLERLEAKMIPHVKYDVINKASDRLVVTNKEHPIIGFMGTWWKHKGMEFMFDELEKLAGSGVKFDFHLAGLSLNPSYQAYVMKRVEKLRTMTTVRNFGELNSTEFTQFAQDCDILLLPHKAGTKVQGSGILMRGLEANACILTSDAVGVFDEVIANSAVSHFAWNDKASFSTKLRSLLNDPQNRMELRASAMQFVNAFHSDEAVMKGLEKLTLDEIFGDDSK